MRDAVRAVRVLWGMRGAQGREIGRDGHGPAGGRAM